MNNTQDRRIVIFRLFTVALISEDVHVNEIHHRPPYKSKVSILK